MWWFGFADSDRPTPQPEAPVPAPAEERAPERDEVGDLILTLLPWGVSVVLHAGLVLLAVFIVWSVQVTIDEEEVIIPIARLSQTPGTPMTTTKTRQIKRTATSRRSLSRRTNTRTESTLNSSVDTSAMKIGAAGGAAGKASPFGNAIRTGGGFESSFFGTGGNAKRIVYLVDASGSLIDTLPFVILELKRSIGQLSEKQTFTVFFFSGSGVIEIVPPRMQRADDRVKRERITWMDSSRGNVIPLGSGDASKALEQALQYKPQLLYLLSDNITGEGIYEKDQRRLLKSIAESNKTGTKINTIQFIYPDKLPQGTLELIAKGTGGEYKFLDARELGIE